MSRSRAYTFRKVTFPTILSGIIVLLCLGAGDGWAADNSLENSLKEYRSRYPLPDPYQKLVNDHGDGFDPLIGVRNFRVVLEGIVYRGGANNTYRKPKRNNENPLPPEALDHLCKEGFGLAIYMYEKNYATAAPSLDCKSLSGSDNNLTYLQKSPLRSNGGDAALDAILTAVHDHLTGNDHRPIYLHCWNGWHASGFASAIVLRQFCGVSGPDAISYWDANTDGVAVPSVETIHKRISAFTPHPEFIISDALKASICPPMQEQQ